MFRESKEPGENLHANNGYEEAEFSEVAGPHVSSSSFAACLKWRVQDFPQPARSVSNYPLEKSMLGCEIEKLIEQVC